jgi:iron-sulfur cluster repair protein YtfE (RIC family)
MMNPSHVLHELTKQHDALRGMMDRCLELADRVDPGQLDETTNLLREVARLRVAFEAHNTFEEQILRPVLAANDAFAGPRLERMVEDHVAEHRAMRSQLALHAGTGGEALIELRDVIETLRAHLEAEERYLLSAKVLRDDLVSLEGSG